MNRRRTRPKPKLASRQDHFREETRKWFNSMAGTSEPVYGEPEEWKFDYSWGLVQIGFWLWMMSDFQRFPSQNEVKSLDPRWVSDMQLAHRLFRFQKSDSPIKQIFDQAMAKQGEQATAWNKKINNNGE